MTDTIENLVLEHLRAIRGDLQALSNKMETLTLRIGSLEDHISAMRKDIAILGGKRVRSLIPKGGQAIVKPLIYVETSVISDLTARSSRDVLTAARQTWTQEWWDVAHLVGPDAKVTLLDTVRKSPRLAHDH